LSDYSWVYQKVVVDGSICIARMPSGESMPGIVGPLPIRRPDNTTSAPWCWRNRRNPSGKAMGRKDRVHWRRCTQAPCPALSWQYCPFHIAGVGAKYSAGQTVECRWMLDFVPAHAATDRPHRYSRPDSWMPSCGRRAVIRRSPGSRVCLVPG